MNNYRQATDADLQAFGVGLVDTCGSCGRICQTTDLTFTIHRDHYLETTCKDCEGNTSHFAVYDNLKEAN